jgi:hypothetical protein
MAAQHFIVARTDLRQTRFIDGLGDDGAALPAGAARLRIARFALTSNNITYAAFGESMHYWDFFPCPIEGFGRIPVWGFADVIESRAEGVAPGERFYGYFPMSTELVVQPTHVGAEGFRDGAAHRVPLAAIYNQYTRCSADPGYRPEQEGEIALLRPLFTTSFLIDDFLADNGFFGAETVLLSSASSKTAYGTAFCLAQRRGHADAVKIVGLTSGTNRAFTEGLGCYDQVLTYDDLDSLPAAAPSAYVDMSGSAALRSRVHGHFGDALRYSCSVGGTHWSDIGSGKGLPGPRPVLFFAPAQGKKRSDDWGAAGLLRRVGIAWAAFMQRVSDPSTAWLTVVEGHGRAALQRSYEALLDGTVPAREGHVLSL